MSIWKKPAKNTPAAKLEASSRSKNILYRQPNPLLSDVIRSHQKVIRGSSECIQRYSRSTPKILQSASEEASCEELILF
jgi:hypothetical protein